MSSKEKVIKVLGDLSKALMELSLDDLREFRDCIDNLITAIEETGISTTQAVDNATALSNNMRQERFYVIFTCRFKKTTESDIALASGIVVDISQGGMRLKSRKKVETGTVLAISPEKAEEVSILAISPEYDPTEKKIFVEVIRVKELMGLYEIGCKFLPQSGKNHDYVL